MAQFIKIKEARINVARISYYNVCKVSNVQQEEYKLVIVFSPVNEIFFKTKDKHELDRWLKALGEEK